MRATDAPATTPQHNPKRPRWPFIVAGLLVVHVALMTVAVVIATHDRSFAVLPNYDDNAVHWDRDQAKRRASAKLGWKLEIVPAETVDPIGRRNVSVRLTDADA